MPSSWFSDNIDSKKGVHWGTRKRGDRPPREAWEIFHGQVTVIGITIKGYRFQPNNELDIFISFFYVYDNIMCINEQVSIATFSICMITCFFLYKRNNTNDRWISILFAYLGGMQFLEYLMWKDQQCKGLNQIATTIGFLHNILQPLISLIIAYYFTNGKIPKYIYAVFVLYLITSLPKIITQKTDDQCSKPCNGGEIGLSWKYTNTEQPTYVWAVFCLALAVPLLAMNKNGDLYAILIIGTYIIAHFISISRCPNNKNSPPNGSWWCMLAALLPLVALKINQ